jgi:hypothetical protein
MLKFKQVFEIFLELNVNEKGQNISQLFLDSFQSFQFSNIYGYLKRFEISKFDVGFSRLSKLYYSLDLHFPMKQKAHKFT